MLNHLDADAITMKEIVRTPMDERTRLGLKQEIQNRLNALVQTDPTAIDTSQPGSVAYNKNHPEVA